MLCTAGLEAAQNPPRFHERHMCSQNGSLLYMGPQLCRLTQLQSLLVVLGVYLPGNPSGYNCTGQWVYTVLQGVAGRGSTAICQVSQGLQAVLRLYLNSAAFPVLFILGAESAHFTCAEY